MSDRMESSKGHRSLEVEAHTFLGRDDCCCFWCVSERGQPVSAASRKHTYRKDIDYAPDGTAWSWTVAECECDQPWRHA